MSLPKDGAVGATRAISTPRVAADATPLAGNPVYDRTLCGGLEDTPAGATDRDMLLAHLGRDVLHGSIGRDFSKAYRTTQDGQRVPRMYRVTSEALGKCEYVMLTNKQYATVLVVDIDQPGSQGGHPINLAEDVREAFLGLVNRHIGPAWVGINPISGKAQALWLIDPVYADESGKSPAMSLLAATTRELGQLLDHDPHFAHRFSRSPFYTGDSPTAYRWYRQHNHVHRLGDLVREVRDMTGQPQYDATVRQQFSSGTELINVVKARREQTQRFKELAKDVEAELGDELDRYDPELIDGVRVLWIRQGRAARDETAFRHALKTGHRLRAAGQRLTDAALIDAYERAYKTAQAVGADGRGDEMPAMRDRLTMARRVRGYVTQSKTDAYGVSTAPGRATSSERKALATMGRRGGKKAAQRWKTDPEGEYAQNERKKLIEANQQRKKQGNETRGRVYALYTSVVAQTGETPTGKQIAAELGITKRTANLHLKALREAGLVD